MAILGLDFGLKHVGVALAEGPLAEPLTTIPFKKSISHISKLIYKYDIEQIVIGQPDPKIYSYFNDFMSSLKTTNCKLIVTDETLSSVDARVSLFHKSKSARAKLEHSVSAAIILQNYLDQTK